ncbi:hypothetical protein PMZ80_005773 [Knufia obscura]|uniref:Uncharacterized protein n=2 Tax=Knufia TaxID=430999 RepID=A0AAN8I6E0_9EURO|nr:hypothetical protein PMZ80_005773 [Knufia obscura]KAK5954439.1 hypothetical protein OHC33_004161 [Knufia fluminis]
MSAIKPAIARKSTRKDDKKAVLGGKLHKVDDGRVMKTAVAKHDVPSTSALTYRPRTIAKPASATSFKPAPCTSDVEVIDKKSQFTLPSLAEIDFNTELGQFYFSCLFPHYRPAVRIMKTVGNTKFEYMPEKRGRAVVQKELNGEEKCCQQQG